LARLLAFADWSTELREIEPTQGEIWPPGAVDAFVREHAADLLERLRPERLPDQETT